MLITLPRTISARDVEKNFAKAKKKLDLTPRPLEVDGFYRLFLSGGKRKRDAICRLVAEFPHEVKFKDDFPLSQEELRLRERIKEVFALEPATDSARTFSFQEDEAITLEERSRRATLKKRQKAGFDYSWRMATEAIVLLKSRQMPERRIVERLANAGITTRNNRKITQAVVNKLYHKFVSTYSNMRDTETQAVALKLQASATASAVAGVPGPRIDRSDMDVKNVHQPVVFEDKIRLKFIKGTYEDLDFYVDFHDREGTFIETLYVKKEYVIGGQLDIDVLKQTFLAPGYYVAEFFAAPGGERLKQASAALSLIVGESFGRVDDIRMGRTIDGNLYPVYQGDESVDPLTLLQARARTTVNK